MAPLQVVPGTVLAVWSSNSFMGTMIRVGAALRGHPAVANHVAVVTHRDQKGRWIGIEGKPGGVGPVDVTRWLTDSRTRANTDQVLPGGTDALNRFLASCAKSIGIEYDWLGIAQDALESIQLDDLSKAIDHLWRWPSKKDELPGQVVCSSLAAMLYDKAGWAHPRLGQERQCTPADWWDFSDRKLWEKAVSS